MRFPKEISGSGCILTWSGFGTGSTVSPETEVIKTEVRVEKRFKFIYSFCVLLLSDYERRLRKFVVSVSVHTSYDRRHEKLTFYS